MCSGLTAVVRVTNGAPHFMQCSVRRRRRPSLSMTMNGCAWAKGLQVEAHATEESTWDGESCEGGSDGLARWSEHATRVETDECAC